MADSGEDFKATGEKNLNNHVPEDTKLPIKGLKLDSWIAYLGMVNPV